MAQQTISLGSPQTQSGDTIRDAFDKCNDNFIECYSQYFPISGGQISGNVGINASPSHNLQVEGGVSSHAQIKLGADSGYKNQILSRRRGSAGNYNDLEIIGNSLSFKTATTDGGTSSAERMRIAQNGDVSIGGEYTFPGLDGAADQVLQTDGAGVLGWGTAGGGNAKILLPFSGYCRYYKNLWYSWNKNDYLDGGTWDNGAFSSSGTYMYDDIENCTPILAPFDGKIIGANIYVGKPSYAFYGNYTQVGLFAGDHTTQNSAVSPSKSSTWSLKSTLVNQNLGNGLCYLLHNSSLNIALTAGDFIWIAGRGTATSSSSQGNFNLSGHLIYEAT